jgi:pilus assembly protein CpaF
MGMDEDGRFLGRLKTTGIRPNFTERLSHHGITLEPSLFTADAFSRRQAVRR